MNLPSTTPLRDVNVGADGYPIDHRQNERAGILSTIMFLERMVREHGVTQELRAEARFQADFLRHLVRRRVRDGKDTLDGALREALEQLMLGQQPVLPSAQNVQATLRIEP